MAGGSTIAGRRGYAPRLESGKIIYRKKSIDFRYDFLIQVRELKKKCLNRNAT